MQGAGDGRILVVDDEPNIRDLLAAALRFEGFEIDTAASGREALERARETRPDLILLDVMLPDLDGYEVARRLHDEGLGVPVVFLTARDATEDKVAGLGVGDDYVTKPFSLDELVARVRAVLRRTGRTKGAAENALDFADLHMDLDAHEVWRAGTLIELTATEFNLLEYLLVNARRVMSKTEILEAVWGLDFAGDQNIVETYISYLRKKIDELPPPLIHTVRMVGYCLRLPRAGEGRGEPGTREAEGPG